MDIKTLNLDEHIGNINRIESIKDLREWEIYTIYNIVKNRPVRYGSINIDSFVKNIASMVNQYITDSVLIRTRMRSRLFGADVSLKCNKPKYVEEKDWSDTLLQSFLRDWTSFVIVESLFSKKFLKKIQNKKTHLALFKKFSTERSIRNIFNKKNDELNSCNISRSAIEFCKNKLDGQWKYREYGASITNKVLKILPKLVIWSDVFLSYNTGFGKKDVYDALGRFQYILNLKGERSVLNGLSQRIIRDSDFLLKPENEVACLKTIYSNATEYELNKFKIDKDEQKYFGAMQRLLSKRTEYLHRGTNFNGIDGILSRRFFESFIRNRDFCFIELVKFFIADARKKNVNFIGGYTVNSKFYKMAISTILRQKKDDYCENKKHPFDGRRMFWNSIVHNYNNNIPVYGSLSFEEEKIKSNKIINETLNNFINISPDDRRNILYVAENELVKCVSLGFISRYYKPYTRRKFWSEPLSLIGKDTANLFSSYPLMVKYFKSKLSSENFFVLFDKLTDLFLSGRYPTQPVFTRADKKDWLILSNETLEYFLDRNRFFDCDSAYISSNKREYYDAGIKTRREILESLHSIGNRWNIPYSMALGSLTFKHGHFINQYHHHLFDNIVDGDGEIIQEVRGEVVHIGCVNNSIWKLWRNYLRENNEPEPVDSKFAFFTFVSKLASWSPRTAKSILGLKVNAIDYDIKGFRWIPDFKNLSDIIDKNDNELKTFIGRMWNARTNDSIDLDNFIKISNNLSKLGKIAKEQKQKIDREILFIKEDMRYRNMIMADEKNINHEILLNKITEKVSKDMVYRSEYLRKEEERNCINHSIKRKH